MIWQIIAIVSLALNASILTIIVFAWLFWNDGTDTLGDDKT